MNWGYESLFFFFPHFLLLFDHGRVIFEANHCETFLFQKGEALYEGNNISLCVKLKQPQRLKLHLNWNSRINILSFFSGCVFHRSSDVSAFFVPIHQLCVLEIGLWYSAQREKKRLIFFHVSFSNAKHVSKAIFSLSPRMVDSVQHCFGRKKNGERSFMAYFEKTNRIHSFITDGSKCLE